jgi:hypothetical protein
MPMQCPPNKPRAAAMGVTISFAAAVIILFDAPVVHVRMMLAWRE